MGAAVKIARRFRQRRPLHFHRARLAGERDRNGGRADEAGGDKEGKQPVSAGEAQQGGADGESQRQHGGVEAEHHAPLGRRGRRADPIFADDEDDGERKPEGGANGQPELVVGAEGESHQRRDAQGDGREQQHANAEKARQPGRQRGADKRGDAGDGDVQAIGMGGKAGRFEPQREQRDDKRQADADNGNAGDGRGEPLPGLRIEGGEHERL